MDLFLETIGSVSDPRASNARYALSDILFIAVVAVLCGVTSCTGFALFARLKRSFLSRFLALPHRLPSHDVFSDVLAALDQKALAGALTRFMDAIGAAAPEPQFAVDGKALRRAYEKGQAHLPAFVATLYDCDRFLTLALAPARDKGGEGEAVMEALRLVTLKGAVVSADALHAKRAVTELIRAKKGHYCIALKGNSPIAFDLAKAALAAAEAKGQLAPFEQTLEAHGRIETRQAIVIPCRAPRNARGKETLPDLKAIGVIRRLRRSPDDPQKPFETSFYALSFTPEPERFATIVRKHWAIENNQHWRLDVLFAEDHNRSRKDNAPVNFAILRRLAQNILQLTPGKETTPLKMLRAAHDEAFLTAAIIQKR